MFLPALESTHPPIPCALGCDTDHTCHAVGKDNFTFNFMVNQTLTDTYEYNVTYDFYYSFGIISFTSLLLQYYYPFNVTLFNIMVNNIT